MQHSAPFSVLSCRKPQKRLHRVLWHGMILHTVGINYSHTIRTALLADFNQEGGRGSEEDCSADPARMWDRWSREVREAPLPPLDPALCPWAAETTARL